MGGKKRKKIGNQMVQGVKYEANNPAGRWAAVGITQITPTASARGTKEPWRSDSKGTWGHSQHLWACGKNLLPTEGPKGTDFIHWLGFSIEQEAEIT